MNDNFSESLEFARMRSEYEEMRENTRAIEEDCMLIEMADYQRVILNNENLMAGFGTRCQFDPESMALKVYLLSKCLYEKTHEYIEKNNK